MHRFKLILKNQYQLDLTKKNLFSAIGHVAEDDLYIDSL